MQRQPLFITVVACGLVALLTAQKHSGFIIVFLLPVFVFWLPYSAYVCWKHPGRRQTQALKVGLWLFTVSSVLVLHWHYARSARAAADLVAAAVEGYWQSHGVFPASLDAAGVGTQTKAQRVMYFYGHAPAPALIYHATFIAFETYSYDFERRTWVYRPD